MDKIILFGAGAQGKKLYEFLKYKNMENIVECFCDNNAVLEGNEIGNAKICTYESCKLKQKKFVITSTTGNYIKEIESILQNNSEKYFTSIGQWVASEGLDATEWNRDFCAWYHINKMDEYFESAESSEALERFWGKDTVFYRMFEQLDLENVIELAVGHGRHIKMYEPKANHIVVVDILQKNIDYCKERYRNFNKIDYYCNNGYNLNELNNNTYTALFSYDAMVHFEMMDIFEYLKDIYRVLKPNGMALLHHSNNTSDYKKSFSDAVNGRNYMSKDLFAYLSYRAGFDVVDQKVIDWGLKDLDCISLLRK